MSEDNSNWLIKNCNQSGVIYGKATKEETKLILLILMSLF